MKKVWMLLSLAAMLSGCASWTMRGEPPEVLVTNVTPKDAGPFEQRLQVDLRVRNPNDFDLAVTGLDVRLDVNGRRLARGLSNKEWLIPRLSDAVVSIETTTSTWQVVRQFLAWSSDKPLTYHAAGTVYTKDGRLPFEHDGTLLEKGALSPSEPTP